MANLREEALLRAESNEGVGEVPLGSNSGPKVDRWLHTALASSPNPWCAAFAFSMKVEVGCQAVKKIPYPASVLSWVETAAQEGWLMRRPFRGDDVAFEWNGYNPHPDDHIGTVSRVLALPRSNRPLAFRGKWWIRTIEGNTGDKVQKRWRWVDPRSVAFIRVPNY